MVLRNPTCARQVATAVVRFSIESADASVGTADVLVEAASCGLRSVPDIDDYGMLTVYDALGCLLDEEEYDLIGRKGYAARMRSLDATNDECRWEIISLCCP